MSSAVVDGHGRLFLDDHFLRGLGGGARVIVGAAGGGGGVIDGWTVDGGAGFAGRELVERQVAGAKMARQHARLQTVHDRLQERGAADDDAEVDVHDGGHGQPEVVVGVVARLRVCVQEHEPSDDEWDHAGAGRLGFVDQP